MPKPVLSDSLFNADDVATAILSEANLQISNSNLGVTDISSSFSHNSNWSFSGFHAFKFNGFVFIAGQASTSSTPSGNDLTMSTITDSTVRPTSDTAMPTASYEGDTGNFVKVYTTGEVFISAPINVGSGAFYVVFNGFYRYA